MHVCEGSDAFLLWHPCRVQENYVVLKEESKASVSLKCYYILQYNVYTSFSHILKFDNFFFLSLTYSYIECYLFKRLKSYLFLYNISVFISNVN